MDILPNEENILQLCQEYPEGVTYPMIQNTFTSIKLEEIVKLINKLLSKNKIDLLKKSDGTPLFKYKNTKGRQNATLGSQEEMMIMKYIEESETNGIEKKDIKFRCNLPLPTITKIVNALEKKRVIKSFCAIHAPKRKRFILAEYQPSEDLIGGTLYEGDTIDSVLINVLTEQCYNLLTHKENEAKKTGAGPYLVSLASRVSVQDVHKYIENLGIVKDKLKEKDIENILQGLVYEAKAIKRISEDGTIMFKANKAYSGDSYLMKIPCGFCPYIHQCSDIGHYNSVTCKYMNNFLDGELDW